MTYKIVDYSKDQGFKDGIKFAREIIESLRSEAKHLDTGGYFGFLEALNMVDEKISEREKVE